MSSDANKRVLEAANDAVARGDVDGFLQYCTDDTTWVFVGDRTLHGKDEVRRWMAQEYLSPPANRVDSLIAEGDALVAVGEITTFDSEGAPSRSQYCDVWHLRDGKLAQLRAFVV